MRVVVQRANNASCEVDHKIVGSIDKGYMLLVGFTHSDTDKDIEVMAHKIIGLRIFEDDQRKLNKSILDVGGSILAISQFTLYADARKGNRPSFSNALAFDQAKEMYERFIEALKRYSVVVEKGIFGADMNIQFTNAGPVTIILDSEDLK